MPAKKKDGNESKADESKGRKSNVARLAYEHEQEGKAAVI
jgi:hypothetical protein